MLSFLDKVKIYEADLDYNWIHLDRSLVFELVKLFRKEKVSWENGLWFVEFVRSKMKKQVNNHYN